MWTCNDQTIISTRYLALDGRHRPGIDTLLWSAVVQSSQADLSLGDVSDGHGREGWDGMGWEGMGDPHALPLARLDRLLPLNSRQSHILFPSRGTRQPLKPSRTAIPVRTVLYSLSKSIPAPHVTCRACCLEYFPLDGQHRPMRRAEPPAKVAVRSSSRAHHKTRRRRVHQHGRLHDGVS